MARPNINVTTAGAQGYENLAFPGISYWLVPRNNAVEVTSGVSRRKPSGWIPPTNYSVYSVHRNGAMGEYRVSKQFSWGTGGYRYLGCIGPSDNSGPVNLQACFDRALTETDAQYVFGLSQQAYSKALQNLKGKKVDLGVAFGERNTTARMVGDAATRLARAAGQLRRGQVRNAMRTLGLSTARGQPRGSNWTNNWLALQYGWKPTLSEIYGACDALSKRHKEDWRVTAKGTVGESVQEYYSVKPGSNLLGAYGFASTAKGRKGAFCRIDAIPSNELLSSLSSVGVTNPLSVAWELVPASFVVDWFLPIGDWLNSLDATLGYDNISVCTSTMSRVDWQLVGLDGETSDGYQVRSDFSGSKRGFWLNRTVTGAEAPPLPRFKNPWSFGHMANGLSLLAQAFR